jgi:uncharacterized SAM-binding protein YcdF (DUF218 family)
VHNIIHLGGNIQRLQKTIQVAHQYPESKVIVSSESDPRTCLQILLDNQISRDRIIFDYNAWDTVTNFTTTYKLIKSLHTTHLHIVTDGFHMMRSLGIGQIVYFRKNVTCIPKASSVGNPENWKLILSDWGRTILWRFTGYLYFDKDVYNARIKSLEEDSKISQTL